MKSFRLTISRLCWALTFIISALYYSQFGKEAYNFYGDALGYYMYLPSTFIYHNHKSIEQLPTDRQIRPFIRACVAQMGNGQRTPKGYVLNQYTYGTALMEAPFFLLAHGWEKLNGRTANGFTETYRSAIKLSTFVYAILGLWITYKVLRRRFTVNIAGLTTALLFLGTNLFWFTLQQEGMAHVPLFFLFALLLYLTEQVYETGRLIHFIGLGITAGMITVIRPADGICVFIPLLYASGQPLLKTKLDFLLKHWNAVLLAGLCFLIPIIPQLLYWKWLTGYSVYDSYGPNQKFDFLHPHIWAGLFGASNGWIFYTPLMLLAIFGFAFFKKFRPFAFGILFSLLIYIYIIYSWYLPNYPNGLGSRPMVDMYALLALPLAAFLDWVLSKRNFIRLTVALFVAGFVAINLSYTWQEALGILWSEDSKYAYNFQTLFRYRLNYNDLVVWDTGIPQPNSGKLKSAGLQYCTSIIDSPFTKNIIADSARNKGKVFFMQQGEEYAPLALTMPYNSVASKHVRWIRCSGNFMTTVAEYDIYKNQLMVLQIKRGTETIAWQGVRINNKVGLLEGKKAADARISLFRDNIWGRVSFFFPLPDNMQADDIFRLDVWNIGKKPVYISELCMDFYK